MRRANRRHVWVTRDAGGAYHHIAPGGSEVTETHRTRLKVLLRRLYPSSVVRLRVL